MKSPKSRPATADCLPMRSSTNSILSPSGTLNLQWAAGGLSAVAVAAAVTGGRSPGPAAETAAASQTTGGGFLGPAAETAAATTSAVDASDRCGRGRQVPGYIGSSFSSCGASEASATSFREHLHG